MKNTSTPETLTDIDGNSYKTVKIGKQIWMAENLRVRHYRNGANIQTGFSNSELKSLSEGAFSLFTNDKGFTDIKYNYFAVSDSRRIAPNGWHVPTFNEWKTMYSNGLFIPQKEVDETIEAVGKDLILKAMAKFKESITKKWANFDSIGSDYFEFQGEISSRLDKSKKQLQEKVALMTFWVINLKLAIFGLSPMMIVIVYCYGILLTI
jgi:uncharacterized protein (TIGR02145 family)